MSKEGEFMQYSQNINLNLYRIFYCVAKEKSITKASKKLFISQPAISKSLKKLESDLNTVLFIRNLIIRLLITKLKLNKH